MRISLGTARRARFRRRADALALRGGALVALLAVGLGAGCGDDASGSACGPARGSVVRVIDGDTVELGSGETVRLLMVDTPEITQGHNDCYGEEAKDFTTQVLLGKTVSLTYDQVCQDAYGRLLAYLWVDGRELNTLLVERGFACVLHIPPNGDDRVDEFRTLEYQARDGLVGMWGACTEVTCAN